MLQLVEWMRTVAGKNPGVKGLATLHKGREVRFLRRYLPGDMGKIFTTLSNIFILAIWKAQNI